MFTLGYAFKPWTEAKAIADGPSIRNYVHETAREYGIDRAHPLQAQGQARVVVDAETRAGRSRPSTTARSKRFTVQVPADRARAITITTRLLPDFKGMRRFKGKLIHPQHWPEDLDYSGKRVVVIGSGATAVTLVPSMTDKAAHVTMLQRSPTYMVSMPAEDKFANWLRRMLPAQLAYDITRGCGVLFQQFFFRLARKRPAKTRERLLGLIREQLGPDYDMQTHFTPRYNPWEQRLCLVPDNDMFLAIRPAKPRSSPTRSTRFTEKGIKLISGKELEADIIVTATGLEPADVRRRRGRRRRRKVDTGKLYALQGRDVFRTCPTSRRCSATPMHRGRCGRPDLRICLPAGQLSRRVRSRSVHAALGPDAGVEDRPFVDFSSGYFQRAAKVLPKQTTTAPWRLNQSYGSDLMALRYGPIEDGVLEFKPAPAAASDARTATRARALA